MTRKEILAWCNAQLKIKYETVAVSAIKRLVQGLDAKAPPHPCHQEAVATWKAFLQKHGVPMVMDARQGKLLKEILQSLERLAKDPSPEGVLTAFAFVLDQYHLLDDWHQRNKTLANMHKNLQEILNKIKHGTAKNNARTTNREQRSRERGAIAQFASTVLLQSEHPHGTGHNQAEE